MKLPDFIEFKELNDLRIKMGADLPESFSFNQRADTLTLVDLEVMRDKGLDINSLDEIRELEDGTLAYKDSRVLLYIRDVSSYRNSAPEDNLPKFHMANCQGLETMRANNRYDRYVVSIREDGKFEMNFMHWGRKKQSTKELRVCRYCLKKMSYEGYGHNKVMRDKIFERFSIEEFFKKYPRSLIINKPKYTSASAPLNEYPSNWNHISETYRSRQRYICENKTCEVDLSAREHKRYLHVHHKNGLKHDCRDSNLEALCIRCHADEHQHQHMKVSSDYKNFMMIYPQLKQWSK